MAELPKDETGGRLGLFVFIDNVATKYNYRVHFNPIRDEEGMKNGGHRSCLKTARHAAIAFIGVTVP